MSTRFKKHLVTQPRLSAITLACLLACTTFAHGAESGLRAATSLDGSTDVVNEDSASFISANHMESTDDQILLRGDAEVRRAGTVIRGDKITYTQSTDEVDVEGNAVVIRQGAKFSGPKLSYKIETQTGEMHNVNYHYAARGLQGKTEYARFESDVSTQLKNATISTCKPGSKAWWIEADSLHIDYDTQMATAEDFSLHVAGMPILGAPWAMFPVGQERQSGLLTPTFGMSSTRGLDVAVPIYWNIAPNYDYTFTPRAMTKRGVILGNELRYMNQYFNGEFTYDYLPEDHETKQRRYGAQVKAQGHWNGFNLNVDYNKVSDGEYVSDFSTNIYETSEDILDQNYSLSYAGDFWRTSLKVNRNPPLMDDDGKYYSKPYEKVPQWTLSTYFADVHGFEISNLLEFTRFTHPEESQKVQGDRFYMNHSIAYPMRGAAWFVTPKAQLTGVAYDLTKLNKVSDGLTNYDKHSSIVAPTFSLDTGLVFERDTSWFGTAATQTLEPRVFYTYTPYRNQTRMPTFDSSLADLSFAGLFTENIFTGHDRLAESNQVSLVLTSRYLDRKSGYEWLRASVGQRFYFDDQTVALKNDGMETGTTSGSRSDYLASIGAHLTKDVSLNATAQYSTTQDRFTRINAGIRWQPKPSSVVGLYYRYNYEPTSPDDHIKQIDLAAQWPLTNKLYGLVRFNYSLYEREPIEALAGIEYVEDCWALRLVAQRYITGDDRYDTSFYIQLELTGLGSIGTNPLSELRRNIPGYHAASSAPVQTGLYDYYE